MLLLKILPRFVGHHAVSDINACSLSKASDLSAAIQLADTEAALDGRRGACARVGQYPDQDICARSSAGHQYAAGVDRPRTTSIVHHIWPGSERMLPCGGESSPEIGYSFVIPQHTACAPHGDSWGKPACRATAAFGAPIINLDRGVCWLYPRRAMRRAEAAGVRGRWFGWCICLVKSKWNRSSLARRDSRIFMRICHAV